MDRKPRKPGGKDRPAQPTRDERLKAALKANIQRRKAQARERGAGGDGAGETGDKKA